MRKLVLLSPVILMLCACGEPPAPPAADVARPVKTLLIGAAEAGGERRFPARIDAGSKAELAFRVAGKVQALKVKEGDRVEEGQVLAELEATDFQIVVKDRQASYDNALKNFNRAKELIEKDHISKMDYDRLEAEFKSANAALEAARQDLSYTELKAPFSGMVAKRYIEQFEEVQAKQLVLDLQDVAQLQVKFDVPEGLIRALRGDKSDDPSVRDRIPVFAAFDDLPGKRFALTFREIATKADPKTQTFEVTYSMVRVPDVRILPGMTATVAVDLSRFSDAEAVFSVPVSAVVGDYKLDPQAWVVDPQTMTVQPRALKVGTMNGSGIQVLDGLAPGDRVVVAGTPFLAEGMKVTLLPESEQAEPRKGE